MAESVVAVAAVFFFVTTVVLLLLFRKQEKEIKRVRDLSEVDELTGLLNRRGFEERVTPFVHQVVSSNMGGERRHSFHVSHLSIVVFDIDRFKVLNDEHGHHFGDAVLCRFAGFIRDSVRETDFACRWGGDEFVVAFTDAGIHRAKMLAENIRVRVSEFAPLSSKGAVNVTVSCGVATIEGGLRTLEGVMRKADGALYRAKKDGRNQVSLPAVPRVS